MDFADGPAALGGIMMCVALGAWTLGRWQGGLVVLQDPEARNLPGGEAGPAPLPHGRRAAYPEVRRRTAFRAEPDAMLGAVGALGELHAEMTAFRHAEQVLVGFEGEMLDRAAPPTGAADECRFVGLLGEERCGLADVTCKMCVPGAARGVATGALPRALQPSPPVPGFTRV